MLLVCDSHGYLFKILGDSFQNSILDGTKVMVDAVSDGEERGKKARSQTEFGRGLHAGVSSSLV